jgi:hypothetical protein
VFNYSNFHFISSYQISSHAIPSLTLIPSHPISPNYIIIAIAEGFLSLSIVASNDINENILLALNREGHEITTFGIGTVRIRKLHIHTFTDTVFFGQSILLNSILIYLNRISLLLQSIKTYLPLPTLFCIILLSSQLYSILCQSSYCSSILFQ